MDTVKQLGPWSSLGNWSYQMVPKPMKFGLSKLNLILSWIWSWRSKSINPTNNRNFHQVVLHLLSKFGGSSFNWWGVIAWTSSKWDKFILLSSIWPWRSRSIMPETIKDLNQGLLHLWSKFGDPSLNRWRVIMWTSSWTDGCTHAHRHTQAMTLAGGQNCPPVKIVCHCSIGEESFIQCIEIIPSFILK